MKGNLEMKEVSIEQLKLLSVVWDANDISAYLREYDSKSAREMLLQTARARYLYCKYICPCSMHSEVEFTYTGTKQCRIFPECACHNGIPVNKGTRTFLNWGVKKGG